MVVDMDPGVNEAIQPLVACQGLGAAQSSCVGQNIGVRISAMCFFLLGLGFRVSE